jgi:GNAT superfamily N-acetyltransferase
MAALIRPRAEGDLAACVGALRATHEANGYPVRWPRDPVRWLTSSGRDVQAWVAAADGAVVGHVALGHDDDIAGTEIAPSLAIMRLFVAPDARGGGVGAALLGAAVDFVRANASRPVLTVVDSGDAAIRLYERLGWRCVGQRRADWHEPDGRHPTMYDYDLDPP